MGYQRGLDGLRAVSVIAVILYHAGFGWMHGGFLGVEVFFVVSGYLITTLLIEEHERAGRIDLRGFWVRRIRRLFPALALVLIAVTLWALFAGSAEQAAQVKRDLPWAVGYLANWGQIAGGVPYFEAVDPPLLRHLWSLAVEEQWYVVWPLVFVAIARWSSPRLRSGVLVAAAFGAYAVAWWVHRGVPSPTDGVFGVLEGADRTNVAYLSTVTRASGLLVGAVAAYWWRPWRAAGAGVRSARPLDVASGVAVGVLVAAFVGAELTAGYMYPWVLALTAGASLVAIAVVVHPAAAGARWVFGAGWLVAVGQRSYGLYLWHWPIFVVAGATDGSWGRFVVASVVTVAIAEASYRFVETPVRRGVLGRWWAARRGSTTRWVPVAGAVVGVAVLSASVAAIDEFDIAVGGEEVEFALDAEDLLGATSTVPVTTVPEASVPVEASTTLAPSTSSTSTTTTTLPVLPRSVAIVGDSTGLSFGVNLPSGIADTFTFTSGAMNGCSIWDTGTGVSSIGATRDFSGCAGWQERWAEAVAGSEVALVIIGAWDVYDMRGLPAADGGDEAVAPFGSPEWDAAFTANLASGVEALRSTGAEVALLEVACMRPQEVAGQGFPPTPERGDDARVAHVNELLRAAAEADEHVHFVPGPVEWCADEAIATDLGYRWDGVHVYKPGANLILEAIAAPLLAIPVPAR
jgi:peptidoglycan/LPS O-acetylase OafA/YrhL